MSTFEAVQGKQLLKGDSYSFWFGSVAQLTDSGIMETSIS